MKSKIKVMMTLLCGALFVFSTQADAYPFNGPRGIVTDVLVKDANNNRVPGAFIIYTVDSTDYYYHADQNGYFRASGQSTRTPNGGTWSVRAGGIIKANANLAHWEQGGGDIQTYPAGTTDYFSQPITITLPIPEIQTITLTAHVDVMHWLSNGSINTNVLSWPVVTFNVKDDVFGNNNQAKIKTGDSAGNVTVTFDVIKGDTQHWTATCRSFLSDEQAIDPSTTTSGSTAISILM